MIPVPPTNLTAHPLTVQPRFEAMIHRRFVRDRVVTIGLEDRFWTRPRREELEIKDLTTDKVLFRVPPRTSGISLGRRLLLDACGVPVVGMEEFAIEPKRAQRRGFALIPDGPTATKELYRFETHFNPFESPLELVQGKQNSATRVQIVGGKTWLSRRSVFTIRRGVRGVQETIATVDYDGKLSDGKYRLSIAPGVDVALMVMFAAALDDQARAFVSSSERRMVERVLKNELERDGQEQQQHARGRRAVSAPQTYQAGRSRIVLCRLSAT